MRINRPHWPGCFIGLTSTMLALTACTPQTPAGTPAITPASHKPAAVRTAPVLPSQVHLPMPASLGPLLGGDKAVSLLVNGIMVNNGGNIMVNNGGNLVSQGGGNYSLFACGAPQTTGQSYFTDIMSLVLTPYAESVLIVNGVLKASLQGGIALDTPKTILDPRGSGKLTVMLSSTASGGLLRVVEGAEFHAANQILAVAFTSPRRGVAVYRSLALHPALGHLALSIRFDLDAGHVSAEGLADPTVLPAATNSAIYRAHWEFDAPQAPTANQATFTMHLCAFNSDRVDACESGARAVTAKFLANGQAAVRMGRVLPTKTALSYTRNDGKGYDDTIGATDDFFLGTDGKRLVTGVPTGLQALAPAASEFLTTYPVDPGTGLPFADPSFAFPESP